MDTVKNLLMAIPFIKKPVDYLSSIETQMDYEGKTVIGRVLQQLSGGCSPFDYLKLIGKLIELLLCNSSQRSGCAETCEISNEISISGQRKAEKTYQIIITVFGIVGFLWGFFIQQLSATVYFVLGGFALSCAIVLPPWPFFRRNPLPWQPIEAKKPAKKSTQESKKKK